MHPLLDDYRRLTRSGGHVVLGDWTVLSVRGADRATFLHNLCTNDVVRLKPGHGCEAFFTDVKGHVLAHAILLCRPDEFLVWSVPGQASQLTSHLEKYVIREDVAVHDQTAAQRLVVLCGERRRVAMGAGQTADLDEPLSHAVWEERDAVVARCPWFGDDAVVVQGSAAGVEPLAAAFYQEGMQACAPAVLEPLRIENGTPYFGADFDASNLPQEVNRNDVAISFTKGCYLGQETVARIDALGHVNKQLVRVRFDAEQVPAAGTVLLVAEQEVGRVTSAAWSPRWDAPLALAMVRRGHFDAGTTLDSAVGTAEVIGG